MTQLTVVEVAATARITRLVVEDEIFRPVREGIEDWAGPDSKLTYLVNCPYCVSVWAGSAVQVLPDWVVKALALSGVGLFTRWVKDVVEGAIQ